MPPPHGVQPHWPSDVQHAKLMPPSELHTLPCAPGHLAESHPSNSRRPRDCEATSAAAMSKNTTSTRIAKFHMPFGAVSKKYYAPLVISFPMEEKTSPPEVYDNHLGGVIERRADRYVVRVGPWHTEIQVLEGDWLAAHDRANNWRLRKAHKLHDAMATRTSVPVDPTQLARLLADGYGPWLVRAELRTDQVPGLGAEAQQEHSISLWWGLPECEAQRQADDTHRAHAHDARFAATEWAAVSGRPPDTLVRTYNRTDIGNLAYMANQAPAPYNRWFAELYSALVGRSRDFR